MSGDTRPGSRLGGLLDTNRLIALGVVLAVAGAGTWWFLATFERYETTTRSGVQGEARRDAYLAVKRLLERFGYDSLELERNEFESTLTQTDGGTLIVMTRGQAVTPDRLELLDDWVRRGGQLVIAGPVAAADMDDTDHDSGPDDTRAVAPDGSESDGSESDTRPRPLFAWAGVEPLWPSANDEDDLPEDYRKGLMAMTVDHLEVPVAFGTGMRLAGPEGAHVLAGDRAGPCALEQRRGRGAIVVLCSLSAFQNRNVGKHRHASAFRALTGRSTGEPLVMWSRDTDLPPLHQWLYARAPQALLAFGLALLAWMASRTVRAGQMADVTPPARRRTMEHIEASGRFAWRHGGAGALLGAMRGAFKSRLERRQPAWASAALEVRLERLARVSGIDAQSVYRTLEAPITERADFIEAVRNLGILWRTV